MTTTIDSGILPTGQSLDAARVEAPTRSTARTCSTRGPRRSRSTPMTILAAEGSYVWDGAGNRMLDFSSQLVNTNIGHQHPKVVAAIQDQAAKLCTIAPQYVNDARSEAARLIAERTPAT